MANTYVNKVVKSNGDVLLDISDSTAVAADVAQGKYFYLATGEKVAGTNTGGSVVIVDSPDSHGGIVRSITATDTVTLQGLREVSPVSSSEVIYPDDDYDGFESVRFTIPNLWTVADVASGIGPSGDIDLTGAVTTSYGLAYKSGITSAKGTLDSASDISCLFFSCTALTTVNIQIDAAPSGSNGTFQGCSALETAVFFAGNGINNQQNCFNGCSNLEVADIYLSRLRNNTFTVCNKLTNLILRNSEAICTMESVGAMNSSSFKSGGSGGTIYIPEVLYNHLGDGTSLDYKSATNWNTFDGYGTITWAKIEGSYYETHYGDGTLIPTN